MVSKFLDDNKPEKWIRIVSNFIDLIRFHLVCQMLTKCSGIESDRMVSNFRKRKTGNCSVVLTYFRVHDKVAAYGRR